MTRQKEQGFTLIEMAIGIVIVSLLVALATVAFSSILRRGFEKKTFEDMEIIADAMTVYAQRHLRVPCPADPTGVTGATIGSEPFGTERGSGVTGSNFGVCDTIENAEGIVPFATLGLPQRLARDRFGNFITYRASITSAQRPATASTLPINSWCMTRPYWHANTGGGDATDDYVSLAKAAFCCGTWIAAGASGVTGDIDIQGSFGPLPNLSRLDPTAGAGGDVNEYRDFTADPPTFAELVDPGIAGFGAGDSTIPPMYPAYILISHGQNGRGSFSSQTGIRSGLGGMTVPELENSDNDVQFYASDRTAPNDAGAGNQPLFRSEIDDIIFWETPSQTLGRIGGVSCTSP